MIKFFDVDCPYTGQSQKISVDYCYVPTIGTLQKSYKKMSYECPLLDECLLILENTTKPVLLMQIFLLLLTISFLFTYRNLYFRLAYNRIYIFEPVEILTSPISPRFAVTSTWLSKIRHLFACRLHQKFFHVLCHAIYRKLYILAYRSHSPFCYGLTYFTPEQLFDKYNEVYNQMKDYQKSNKDSNVAVLK